MKRRREGTLSRSSYSTDDGDDFEELFCRAKNHELQGFSGLTDFFVKAERLADSVLTRHELPSDWPVETSQHLAEYPDELAPSQLDNYPLEVRAAVELKLEIWRVKAHLRDPLPQNEGEAIYAAIGAGLKYLNLHNERRHDEGRRGKITLAKYFAAKKKCRGKKAAMALELDVDPRGLRAWERENIE